MTRKKESLKSLKSFVSSRSLLGPFIFFIELSGTLLQSVFRMRLKKKKEKNTMDLKRWNDVN